MSVVRTVRRTKPAVGTTYTPGTRRGKFIASHIDDAARAIRMINEIQQRRDHLNTRINELTAELAALPATESVTTALSTHADRIGDVVGHLAGATELLYNYVCALRGDSDRLSPESALVIVQYALQGIADRLNETRDR